MRMGHTRFLRWIIIGSLSFVVDVSVIHVIHLKDSVSSEFLKLGWCASRNGSPALGSDGGGLLWFMWCIFKSPCLWLESNVRCVLVR
ncbi:unnamed protein product [Sphenostylis stenocarpa]|uniref:Uncharacterized protein n=1 Tax=Sphenostylis stenocarpa TaxID=92480 RepID=A0AA87BBT0_9FABA|nr:unnamed protein product [Sphenostylis stenocarpa]